MREAKLANARQIAPPLRGRESPDATGMSPVKMSPQKRTCSTTDDREAQKLRESTQRLSLFEDVPDDDMHIGKPFNSEAGEVSAG